jgi:hypothetical protein
MKSSDLDTKDAGNFKFAALRDARMRNYAMSSSYSEAQKVAAERMKLVIEMVYSAKSIHINYRKKFIAVKVEGAVIRDRKSLVLLEKDWDAQGYKKAITDQGVVYRIPKV